MDVTMEEAKEPLLLNAPKAAALCGLGVRTWHRHNAAGRVPLPVRIGGRRLWRREELADWVADGCPPRSRWTWPKGKGR